MYTGSVRNAVLITGASSGFGQEFARIFAKEKYDLILVARSQDKLEELAHELKEQNDILVKIITADLADPKSAKKIYESVIDAQLEVSILINNAGFATYGRFDTNDYQEELDEIEVNVVSLTQLTKLFLPAMIHAKSGRILNVASTAAFLPGPLMAVYYATKAYVLSFSEALSEELKGTGVSVSVLCPGPTKTGFATRAKLKNSPLFRNATNDVSRVVKAGYTGLMAEEVVIIPGIGNKLQVQLLRILPRGIVRRVVKRAQRES